LHEFELRERGVVLQRFGERSAVELGDLIRSDHDAVRAQCVDCACLCQCQPQRGLAGPFASQHGFVDCRGVNVEIEAQALQQFAPVRR
jgi:hypothetical protein